MLPTLYGKTARTSSLFSRRSLKKSPTSTVSEEHHERGDFVYRNGAKYHAYNMETAPYPLSYDRETMELYEHVYIRTPAHCNLPLRCRNLLDRALIYRVKDNAVTFTDYKDCPPKRCLDLGCGVRVFGGTTCAMLNSCRVSTELG